jgi:endonuclease/exonuclease/phosphatase family metal-dependent hydrolase
LVVRTWNVFHGNASPPERHAFLADMVRLVTADAPAIVCLQELPVWSLGRLEAWSGMTAIGAVAARPLLGSRPAALGLERGLTELHNGLLRSALTGQANAILLDDSLPVLQRRTIRLNPPRFRRQEARRLRLNARDIARWAKNRRVCQVIRARRGGSTLVVANVHATGDRDKRIVDAEILRAASFVDGFAEPGEPVVLAGDFNVTVENSQVLRDLLSSGWGFEGATPTGIDHVLVRDLEADLPTRWPTARRTHAGRVLSDHAPVERMLS